jgi:hypothetical protein
VLFEVLLRLAFVLLPEFINRAVYNACTEWGSGNHGLLQVQYVFLELPELAQREPGTGAEQWAWLFVHAPELEQVPGSLPQGPYRQALELANKATFTQEVLDAY